MKVTRESRVPWNAVVSSIIFVISSSLAVLLFTSAAVAGVRWTADGVPISAPLSSMPQVAPDDAGGAIVAWIVSASPYELRVQRLDPNGNARWTANGVLVAQINGPVLDFGIAPDASHGAYLAWIDRVNPGPYDHIYAQHVDADGGLLTPPPGKPGMPVCEAEESGPTAVQANLSIHAGVAGEALVAWEDNRNGDPDKDIYAQCMDSNGTPRWILNGVQVASDNNNLQTPTIIPNSSSSCAVTWVDWYDPSNPRVMCQKLALASGQLQWPNTGAPASRPVSTNPAPEEAPCVTGDGGGGLIVAWNDVRDGYRNIYTQRLSGPDGNRNWGDAAVALRTNNGLTVSVPSISRMIEDWAGGAIVAWEDIRGIYAQRVNSAGITQWYDQGVALGAGGMAKYWPEVTTDGQGGAIVSWADPRSGNLNVYAQRVTSGGAVKWTPDGVPVCTVADATPGNLHPYIASDVTGGGAVVVWDDNRTGGGGNKVYAQRVSNDAPTLSGITPTQASNTESVNANLTGTGFFNCTSYSGTYRPTAKLKHGSTLIWATNVTALADSDVGATFNLNGAPVGGYDLYVWNPDGQMAVKTGAFTVIMGKPAITGLSSTTAAPGDLLTITGTNFGNTRGGAGTSGGADPSYVSFGGMHANDYKSWSNTKIEVYVPSGASSGNVSVVTAAGASNARPVSIVYPRWYLAEGSSDWGFECWISIINPNKTAVTCNVTYMPTTGANVTQRVSLPAQGRVTLYPKDKIGAADFSTRVECTDATKTIAVDRTMTWLGAGATTPEAHSSVGVTSPAKQWFLAEGSTAWGFECWLLIQNPNPKAVTAHVTYMIEGGEPVNKDKVIPANSRKTFNVADDIGSKDASIQVSCDQGVIPERAMYRNSRREGHDSIGTTNPTFDYFLAEGTTNYGFTTFVLVQNPTQDAADVTLTYMTNSGPKPQPQFTMPALSRKTVKVNDVLPGQDFSTQVHSNLPIIAERAMYWNNGTGEACHDSIGMEAPHTTFYLPDGQVGSDVETFTLVQNPNSTAVNVTVTYLLATGAPVTFNDTVAANSRKTYNMQDKGVSGQAGIVVTSTSAAKKIMVERAMYFYNRGAGTDTIGGYAD